MSTLSHAGPWLALVVTVEQLLAERAAIGGGGLISAPQSELSAIGGNSGGAGKSEKYQWFCNTARLSRSS
eukprot:scaffold853_cov386-Prasinococcus_capsulatus_cf.AAC.20